MKIDVLTIFPEMFNPVTTDSMLGRAVRKGILNIELTNIRDYTQDKHNRTDDYTFGGGGGMVMTADPVFRALHHIGAEGKKLIYMSPRGRILDESKVRELSELEEFVILCGHYEGVDQRILDYWNAEEISIGDYVLTGGELPAMVLIDSVARFVPGVLGNSNSVEDESVYSGLLEYPHYTQPREYEGMEVPEVLVSGNHKKIKLWRFRQSLLLTRERRPDLFEKFINETENLSREEKKILDEVLNG
ncbi:MAG: tRNA (guanosine(37)-N1)-methyltransferase TrmD [Clostridiales bacterium]|nr:tRNA (guanosine(37)-N1)-methyltransferase TrmD [Clostridiales bacterium]MDD7035433.1 tRNA (guanosine(37)-N1)-methyltransferase TrmD [Bacillota bacterium]